MQRIGEGRNAAAIFSSMMNLPPPTSKFGPIDDVFLLAKSRSTLSQKWKSKLIKK